MIFLPMGIIQISWADHVKNEAGLLSQLGKEHLT